MSSEAPAANLHKDPVTGEMISKTCVLCLTFALLLATTLVVACRELKRRQKEREKEEKKAAKAPAQPAAAKKADATPAADAEENLTPNVRAALGNAI